MIAKIHPETGKILQRDVRPQTVKFGSMTRIVEVPGWYPDDDSDSIHSGADLAELDRVLQELKDSMDNKVSYKKALWIANEMNEDPDDVYDVLLGNITRPSRFVAQVEDAAAEYDRQKERGGSQPF